MEIDSGVAASSLGSPLPLRDIPVHAPLLPVPSELLGVCGRGVGSSRFVEGRLVGRQKVGAVPSVLRGRS